MTQNQFLIIILMDNTSQQVPQCSLSFLVSGEVNRESLKIQLDFPKSALVLKVLSLLFDLAGERNSTLIAWFWIRIASHGNWSSLGWVYYSVRAVFTCQSKNQNRSNCRVNHKQKLSTIFSLPWSNGIHGIIYKTNHFSYTSKASWQGAN